VPAWIARALARGLDGARRAGGEAIVLPTDVANPDQVETAAQSTEQAFRPIDMWVNNAMTTVFAPFAVRSIR